MGSLEELRQRLHRLHDTVGEIVKLFKDLNLSPEEVCACSKILDYSKGTVEVVLDELREVANSTKTNRDNKILNGIANSSADSEIVIKVETLLQSDNGSSSPTSNVINLQEVFLDNVFDSVKLAVQEDPEDDDGDDSNQEDLIESHSEQKHSLRCNRCQKKCKDKQKLRQHEDTCSSDVKPFKILACPICNHQCTKKHSLQEHLAVCQARHQRVCKECTRTFPNDKGLEKHMIDHSKGKLIYDCEICRKAYSTLSAQFRHKQSHERLTCDLCGKIYRSKESLNRHKLICQGGNPNVCPTCNKVFNSVDELQKHDKTHAKTMPFICTICKRRVKSKSNLRMHLTNHIVLANNTHSRLLKEKQRNGNVSNEEDDKDEILSTTEGPEQYDVHDVKPDVDELDKSVTNGDHSYSSSEVDDQIEVEAVYPGTRSKTKDREVNLSEKRSMASLSNKIKRQRSIVTNKKSSYSLFECSKCDQGFNNRRQLIAHRKNVHLKERPHKCSTCGKEYLIKSQLDVHIRHYHTGERPFKCDICEKAFHQSGALKYHKELHIKKLTGAKDYQCTICGKGFFLKRYLQQHMATHNNADQSFVCSQCGKSYKSKGGLEKHELDHSKAQRPYPCHLCNKGYFSQKQLTEHIRSHTGEKPFQCNHCGKCFPQKRSLIEHEMIHTGDKPYKCSFCDQSFVRPFMLRTHEANYHTGRLILPCKICGKNFGVLQALNKHMETHKERPILKCPHPGCDVTVRTEKGLKGHLDGVHGDGKKFKCSCCDKRYKDKYSLMLHSRVHTGEKPFKCATCGMLYTQANPLKRHCESKGHEPVSLVDPGIKRRMILYKDKNDVTTADSQFTHDRTSASVAEIVDHNTTDIGASETLEVVADESLSVNEVSLVYAQPTTLADTYQQQQLPITEILQKPSQQQTTQEASQLPQESPQQVTISGSDIQRLETHTVDDSTLNMYHTEVLPNHTYMTL